MYSRWALCLGTGREHLRIAKRVNTWNTTMSIFVSILLSAVRRFDCCPGFYSHLQQLHPVAAGIKPTRLVSKERTWGRQILVRVKRV